MAKPVLIVDDDADIRQLMQDTVESAGYPSVGAWNGREALNALEILRKSKSLPGVILLDLKMPVMDGQTFISMLSQMPDKISKIPVVIMSAYAAHVDGLVEDYMMKPPNIDRVLNIVEKFC